MVEPTPTNSSHFHPQNTLEKFSPQTSLQQITEPYISQFSKPLKFKMTKQEISDLRNKALQTLKRKTNTSSTIDQQNLQIFLENQTTLPQKTLSMNDLVNFQIMTQTLPKLQKEQNTVLTSDWTNFPDHATKICQKQEKLTREISDTLKLLRENTLHDTGKKRNLFAHNWNTFTPKHALQPQPKPFFDPTTSNYKKWEKIVDKAFSFNQQFWPDDQTETDKLENWEKTKQKYESTKKEREIYDPKFIFLDNVSSLDLRCLEPDQHSSSKCTTTTSTDERSSEHDAHSVTTKDCVSRSSTNDLLSTTATLVSTATLDGSATTPTEDSYLKIPKNFSTKSSSCNDQPTNSQQDVPKSKLPQSTKNSTGRCTTIKKIKTNWQESKPRTGQEENQRTKFDSKLHEICIPSTGIVTPQTRLQILLKVLKQKTVTLYEELIDKISVNKQQVFHNLKEFLDQDLTVRHLQTEIKTVEYFLQLPSHNATAYKYSDVWTQSPGILDSLQFSRLSLKYPFVSGLHYFPDDYNGPTDERNFLNKLYLQPGIVTNPPYSSEHLENLILHQLYLSLKQRIVTVSILPFRPDSEWYRFLVAQGIPILQLQRPILFTNEQGSLQTTSPAPTILVFLGARGHNVTTSNSPTGTFFVPKSFSENISLPPPPLDFEHATNTWEEYFASNDLNGTFLESPKKIRKLILSNLTKNIFKLTQTIDEIEHNGKLFPETDVFANIMSENIRDVLTKDERLKRNGVKTFPKLSHDSIDECSSDEENRQFHQKLFEHNRQTFNKSSNDTHFNNTPLEFDHQQYKTSLMFDPHIDQSRKQLLIDKLVSKRKKHIQQNSLLFSPSERANYRLLFPKIRNTQQQAAENTLLFNSFLPPLIPDLLKFTLRDSTPRIPIKNFYFIKSQIAKKYTLSKKPTIPCYDCGQTTHGHGGCWQKELTCNQLKSTDPRDAFLIEFFQTLPKFDPLEPPQGKTTLPWLLDTYWPTILEREQFIFNEISQAFKQRFPHESYTEYLEKFKIMFSRLWWGLSFSQALGINKKTTLRSALGIPRHNTISTEHYEVLQKRSAEIEKLIHALHEKKVAEGKLVEVPEWLPEAILPIFNIQEKDKIRMITDALHANVQYPPQSVRMTSIKDLFFFSQQIIAMALDLMSAYDQVPSTPHAMLSQGAMSKDEYGRYHYYLWTGICQGFTPGPRRCQGHFNELLNPMRQFFLDLKLYIDDLLTLTVPHLSTQQPPHSKQDYTDTVILHQSLLLHLHKLGIRLSPKAYPQLTTTPKYLGYVMDFRNKQAFPQTKHFYKLANLIFDILDPAQPTPFRTLLRLKGTAIFIFGPEISHLFQEMDNYLKTQYYVFNKGVEDVLTNHIPDSPKLYNILLQLVALLHDFDNIIMKPPSYSQSLQHQIVIITDANLSRAGGFLFVNGQSFEPIQNGQPTFGQSVQMENLHSDYRYKILKQLQPSTTDEERAAALFFTTNILPQVFETFPQLTPANTEILMLTDNKPLYFQLNKTLNTSAKANHEIKKIQAQCKKFSQKQTYLWHPRDTVEGDVADSYTRETELCLNPLKFSLLKHHFQVKNFQNPLSMHKLATLQIFDPSYITNTKIRHSSTLLIFPSPSTANKQIINILHFLKFRRLQGIIILPNINLFKKFLAQKYFSQAYDLGPIRHPYFLNIPRSLRKKKFSLIATKFDFTDE